MQGSGSNTSGPSFCVTCPNRLSGVCGTILGSRDAAGKQIDKAPRFFPVRAGGQIAGRSQAIRDVFVLCAGWAFRFVQLSDGRRQIVQFLLPGDILCPEAVFEKSYMFSVAALTNVMVGGFAHAGLRERYAEDSVLQAAISRCCIAAIRDATELAAVVGQCSAEERIAHLLLRLVPRIAARNVIREHSYPFPLRQQHVADAVGLTPVHVSRVFGLLRERGVVSISEGILRVSDMAELERLGSLN